MPTRDVRTFTAKDPLEIMKPELAVLIGVVMHAGLTSQQGDVLGEITAAGASLGQVRRRTRALATGSGFSTLSTTGTVDDASIFKPGDVITNAAGNTVGTIAANGINAATNTITLTNNAATAVAAGAAVLGSDGSQKAIGIADDGTDGVGATSCRAFVVGLLKRSRLRGLDATAISELGGRTAPGNIFIF